MAQAALNAPTRSGVRMPAPRLLQYLVLATTAFLVLYPILLLVASSFEVSPAGAPPAFGIAAWSTALSQPGIRAALWNTLALVLVRQSISFVVAVVIAWVIARTDIPGRRWLEFLFLLAFFLPTIPVVEAWVLLLDPDYGIINTALAWLPSVREPPFDIYTFAGIIWVHLAHTAIAIKIVLLVPLFRTMDSSLEEMGRLSGLSTLGTLARITLPILAPGLLIVLLIGSIATMQSFEIEQILGPPFRFSIFSTEVYRLINRDPPNYGAATALSTFILATIVPFILAQRWVTSRSRNATVGGRFRGTAIALGRWRRPVFGAILGFALLTTVVPIGILIVFSFATKWGYYTIPHPWTTDNWTRVFTDRTFLASFSNSLQLGAGTAVAGMAGFSVVGYIAVRTRFAWRGTLDVLTWLPSALPGIILSLGLLDLYLGSPVFRPLYGGILGMVIATFIGCMTIGVQVIKSNLMQLGAELEESAWIAGGNWFQAYRRVILPLTMPTILLCGTLSFAFAIRNVSTVVFLGSADTRPLSLLQLDYMMEGWYEPACVVGIVLALLTAAVATVAAYYSARFEIAR
jgi:iron(III) transport system permease protein